MATNYLDVYDAEIRKVPSTAAAPRQKKKARNRLTKRKARGALSASAPSRRRKSQRRTSARKENVVARKKKRSAAQIRATRKMIRANKARLRGKRSKGHRAKHRRGRKNPLVVSGKKVKARKVRRGRRKVLRVTGTHLRVRRVRKGARSAPRKSSGRKAKTARRAAKRSGGGGLTKRQRAARKAARTRKLNAEMRSARARKAAKSRKRGKRAPGGHRYTKPCYGRGYKKRKVHKGASRGIKSGLAKAEAEGYAYESRRGRRRHHRRRSHGNPLPNPIPLEGGLDFFSGLFAVTLGAIFTMGGDRLAATHALTASSAQGGYTDAPGAGEIYNSEAANLPIWSSWKRLLAAAVNIFGPLGLSAVVKTKGPKAFLQLWSFSAIAFTTGKASMDGLSYALKSTSFGLRILSPEYAAQAKLSGAGTAALPAAAPGLFAGAPAPQPQISRPNPSPMIAPPPAPAKTAAPPNPGRTLDTGHPMVSGPSFNPFAADPGRNWG